MSNFITRDLAEQMEEARHLVALDRAKWRLEHLDPYRKSHRGLASLSDVRLVLAELQRLEEENEQLRRAQEREMFGEERNGQD